MPVQLPAPFLNSKPNGFGLCQPFQVEHAYLLGLGLLVPFTPTRNAQVELQKDAFSPFVHPIGYPIDPIRNTTAKSTPAHLGRPARVHQASSQVYLTSIGPGEAGKSFQSQSDCVSVRQTSMAAPRLFDYSPICAFSPDCFPTTSWLSPHAGSHSGASRHMAIGLNYGSGCWPTRSVCFARRVGTDPIQPGATKSNSAEHLKGATKVQFIIKFAMPLGSRMCLLTSEHTHTHTHTHLTYGKLEQTCALT